MAEIVMPRYADWVEALPGYHVFAAAPMSFDGLWMDHYLSTFAGTRVLGMPTRDRQIFRGGGVCLYTMAGTLRGAEYLKWGMQRVPAEWYGHVPHSHRAIDDARARVQAAMGGMGVPDLVPGPGSSFPVGMSKHGDRVYYCACDHDRGCEPWVTDGTAPGTRRLDDIAPGVASSCWDLDGPVFNDDHLEICKSLVAQRIQELVNFTGPVEKGDDDGKF